MNENSSRLARVALVVALAGIAAPLTATAAAAGPGLPGPGPGLEKPVVVLPPVPTVVLPHPCVPQVCVPKPVGPTDVAVPTDAPDPEPEPAGPTDVVAPAVRAPRPGPDAGNRGCPRAGARA